MSPDNPYRAPASDVRAPLPAQPGSLVKAVLAGVLIDQVGTIVSRVLMGMMLSFLLLARGQPPDTLVAVSQQYFAVGTPLFMVSVVLGLACSVLGAYVCARIARRYEYRLAAVLVVIGLGLSGIMVLAMPGILEDEQVWVTLLSFALTQLSILLGAWLGRRRNRAVMQAR